MEINRLPLYQQAYLALRDAIANGQLEPGDRVDVQTMADQLEISRTPVREAIRQLIQEGLLESERGGRARVYSPSAEDLAEIYLIRASLEAMAAEVIAAGQPPVDLSPLEIAHDRSLRALEADDWQEVSDANTSFHEGIVELSGNATCVQLLDTIRLQVLRYRKLSMQFPERRRIAVDEHGTILELLRNQDSGVRQYLSTHVLRAAKAAMEILSTKGEEDTPAMKFIRQSVQPRGK